MLKLSVYTSAKFINTYCQELNRNIKGLYLSRPCLYSKRDLVFSLSSKKGEFLIFSLDQTAPRISISMNDFSGRSFETPFIQKMKKEVGNANILSIQQLNEDRLLVLNLVVLNSVFKEVRRKLIFEMLPHHPNLILLDENERIITLYKEGSLEDRRQLIIGLPYEPLEKPNFKPNSNEETSIEKYEEECLHLEETIRNNRRKDLFGKHIAAVKQNISSISKKSKKIEADIEEATKHLDDGKYGDQIYIGEGVDFLAGTIELDGKTITFDPNKRKSSVASSFYLRAKKAKTALLEGNKNKAKAEKEKEEKEAALFLLENGNEETLLELYPVFQKTKTSKSKQLSSKQLALPMASTYLGTRYLFGRNAKENDTLSFHLATSKNHYWLHIQGDSGAHLIIKKDNPSNEELTYGAGVCLLLSNKEDGDVSYALHKDIRKGKALGQVILSSFKTIHLKSIPEQSKIILDNAKRLGEKDD